MQQKILKFLKIDTLYALPAVLRELLKDEAIGGKIILVAAVLALLIANSPLKDVYESFWEQILSISIANLGVSLDLRHWVSEGLMAIFFLVVGLEIKRELVKGQLRYAKTALLPIGAAIGGMIVPAVLFIAINANQPDSIQGWAIPTATDIAFALAIMSLLGNRVSPALKLFLLTLAIVDDIGSIAVIALFYGSGIVLIPALLAIGIAAVILIISKIDRMSVPLFVLLGIAFWYVVFKSGIHASIAGAFLGFLAPLKTRSGVSVAEKLETQAIPLATFFVVPLFAFSSLGLSLDGNAFSSSDTLLLAWGIIVGFVVGKLAGVSLTSWILVKLKLAELPHNTNWFQIIGVGFLAGVGFTVSVFIADIAFVGNNKFVNASKISVLLASIISAVCGYLFLRHRKKVEKLLLKNI